MFRYHVRVDMRTWWAPLIKAMLVLVPLLSLCDLTGAMPRQDLDFGVSGDASLPSPPGRRLQKFSVEMRNILQPLDSILRYQRSQLNSRRQTEQDYPKPLVHEIPLDFHGPTSPLGYHVNRRKYFHKTNRIELRQRQLAALEASELIKNPSQVKKMLKVFLTEIRNRVNANPHLSKKIEDIMAARVAASAAGSKPGQQQDLALQPMPPDLPPPDISAAEPGIDESMQQPDDTAMNSQQAPDVPSATEEQGEEGLDADSSELRRSLCHFKLCPLWRKPWQDN